MAHNPPPSSEDIICVHEGVSSPPDVPTYTATAENSLYTRIAEAKALKLPILHADTSSDPNAYRLLGTTSETRHLLSSPSKLASKDEEEAQRLERDIVRAFYDAIEAGHNDLVSDFVSRGLVSPDVARNHGEKPLYAAVKARRTPMVSTLVALGATVNASSKIQDKAPLDRDPAFKERTPLMLAAEIGHLALVKVLMEDYGADDSIVAPDGAIALRLAAENGHREIVEYLPARRGGAWLRWKAAHRRELRQLRKAFERTLKVLRVIFWELPKLLFYEAPQWAAKKIWKRRRRIAAWCKRVPSMVKRGVIELPRRVQRAIKTIPHVIKELALEMWKVIKRIPRTLEIIFNWIGQGLKSAGQAVLHVITRLLALIHTLVSAAVDFFRTITLKDVWDGFCYFLAAVFVDTPMAIWGFVLKFGDTSYKVMKQLFGCMGMVVWHIFVSVFGAFKYLPEKIATAVVRLVRKAYIELMVLIDPKRV